MAFLIESVCGLTIQFSSMEPGMHSKFLINVVQMPWPEFCWWTKMNNSIKRIFLFYICSPTSEDKNLSKLNISVYEYTQNLFIYFSFWSMNKKTQKKSIYILFQIPMMISGSEMSYFNWIAQMGVMSLNKNFPLGKLPSDSWFLKHKQDKSRWWLPSPNKYKWHSCLLGAILIQP